MTVKSIELQTLFSVDEEENDVSVAAQCNSQEFMCHSDRYCIDIRRKCDGRFDCSDQSDERDCRKDIL